MLQGYSHNDPSYLVRVESVPDGYSHGSDEPIYFGYIGLEEKVGYSLYIFRTINKDKDGQPLR